MATDDGFLTRWSRRKVQAQRGTVTEPASTDASLAETPAAAAPKIDDQWPGDPPRPATAPPTPEPEALATTPPPPPTLAEAQSLTRDADFTRFVGRDIDPQISNAAMKTLFSDPHFNVMDGLDTYIDDYGKPDPLPPGMLRKMVQSAMLGLFAGEQTEAAAPGSPGADTPPSALPPLPDDTAATQPDVPTDEDTDLRLQPDHDAGRSGAEPGAGEDPGGER
jgi:hypothetical protein